LTSTTRGLGKAKPLSFVLNGANDRSEDRSTRATSNCMRDYAANAEVARLCSRKNRRQNQTHDLTKYATAGETRNDVSNCSEIELR